MAYTIEEFVSNDQQAVKNFIVSCWKEFGFRYIQKYDYDLDDPTKYYIKNGGMLYVLKEKNIIIGTIAVVNKNNEIGELRRFYVEKSHRGKGLGSQLLSKTIEFCQSKKFKKIEFETNKIFKQAHALYEQKGFITVKEDDRSLYMEKLLE